MSLFRLPPEELRDRLRAIREAKHERAAELERVVARFFPRGTSTVRIGEMAGCSVGTVHKVARKLGVKRPERDL